VRRPADAGWDRNLPPLSQRGNVISHICMISCKYIMSTCFPAHGSCICKSSDPSLLRLDTRKIRWWLLRSLTHGFRRFNIERQR
jgi:hypothetical protein